MQNPETRLAELRPDNSFQRFVFRMDTGLQIYCVCAVFMPHLSFLSPERFALQWDVYFVKMFNAGAKIGVQALFGLIFRQIRQVSDTQIDHKLKRGIERKTCASVLSPSVFLF